MKKLKTYQLAGFTIVESLVAMVLVLMTFGIGIMSFHHLTDGDQIIQSSRIAEIVDNQMIQILEEGVIEAAEVSIGGVTILSEAIPIDNQFQVGISAKNNLGWTIYELRTHISAHEWNQ